MKKDKTKKSDDKSGIDKIINNYIDNRAKKIADQCIQETNGHFIKKIKEIKDKKTEFVVVQSGNNCSIELKSVTNICKEKLPNLGFYFIKNAGFHWDTDKVDAKENRKSIESATTDHACGCYTVLQIVGQNKSLAKGLEKVLQAMDTDCSKVREALDAKEDKINKINELTSKVVREFVTKAMDCSTVEFKQTLYSIEPGKGIALSNNHIMAALNGLSIPYIESGTLINSITPELNSYRNHVKENLKQGTQSELNEFKIYLDEKKQDKNQFTYDKIVGAFTSSTKKIAQPGEQKNNPQPEIKVSQRNKPVIVLQTLTLTKASDLADKQFSKGLFDSAVNTLLRAKEDEKWKDNSTQCELAKYYWHAGKTEEAKKIIAGLPKHEDPRLEDRFKLTAKRIYKYANNIQERIAASYAKYQHACDQLNQKKPIADGKNDNTLLEEELKQLKDTGQSLYQQSQGIGEKIESIQKIISRKRNDLVEIDSSKLPLIEQVDRFISGIAKTDLEKQVQPTFEAEKKAFAGSNRSYQLMQKKLDLDRWRNQLEKLQKDKQDSESHEKKFIEEIKNINIQLEQLNKEVKDKNNKIEELKSICTRKSELRLVSTGYKAGGIDGGCFHSDRTATMILEGKTLFNNCIQDQRHDKNKAGNEPDRHGRGMNVVVIHAHTGEVIGGTFFDTYFKEEESSSLTKFLQYFKDKDHIIAITVLDEATCNLTPAAKDYLRTLKSSSIHLLGDRQPWIFAARGDGSEVLLEKTGALHEVVRGTISISPSQAYIREQEQEQNKLATRIQELRAKQSAEEQSVNHLLADTKRDQQNQQQTQILIGSYEKEITKLEQEIAALTLQCGTGIDYKSSLSEIKSDTEKGDAEKISQELAAHHAEYIEATEELKATQAKIIENENAKKIVRQKIENLKIVDDDKHSNDPKRQELVKKIEQQRLDELLEQQQTQLAQDLQRELLGFGAGLAGYDRESATEKLDCLIVCLLQAVFSSYPLYMPGSMHNQSYPLEWAVHLENIKNRLKGQSKDEEFKSSDITTDINLKAVITAVNDEFKSDQIYLDVIYFTPNDKPKKLSADGPELRPVPCTLLAIDNNYCLVLPDAYIDQEQGKADVEDNAQRLCSELLKPTGIMLSLCKALIKIKFPKNISLDQISLEELTGLYRQQTEQLQDTEWPNFNALLLASIEEETEVPLDAAPAYYCLHQLQTLCAQFSDNVFSSGEEDSLSYLTQVREHFLKELKALIDQEYERRIKQQEELLNRAADSPLKKVEQEIHQLEQRLKASEQVKQQNDETILRQKQELHELEQRGKNLQLAASASDQEVIKQMETMLKDKAVFQNKLTELMKELPTQEKLSAYESSLQQAREEIEKIESQLQELRQQQKNELAKQIQLKIDLAKIEGNKQRLMSERKNATEDSEKVKEKIAAYKVWLEFLPKLQKHLLQNQDVFKHKAILVEKWGNLLRGQSNWAEACKQFLAAEQLKSEPPLSNDQLIDAIDNYGKQDPIWYDNLNTVITHALAPPKIIWDGNKHRYLVRAYNASWKEIYALCLEDLKKRYGLELTDGKLGIDRNSIGALNTLPECLQALIKQRIQVKYRPIKNAVPADQWAEHSATAEQLKTIIPILELSHEDILRCFVENIEVVVGVNLYLDESAITLPGVNLTLHAQQDIVVEAPLTIDTSGKSTPAFSFLKARDGMERRTTTVANGESGEDGQNGLAGSSAGHINILAGGKIQGLPYITVKANGGKGTDGQAGGKGDEGQKGKGTNDAQPDDTNGWEAFQFNMAQARVPGFASHSPKPGDIPTRLDEISGRGGAGGLGGLGGEGGYAGEILLEDKQNHISKPVGQSIIIRGVEAKINSQYSNEAGTVGANASGGDGGSGGEPGAIGCDAYLYKKSFYHKTQSYKGLFDNEIFDRTAREEVRNINCGGGRIQQQIIQGPSEKYGRQLKLIDDLNTRDIERPYLEKDETSYRQNPRRDERSRGAKGENNHTRHRAVESQHKAIQQENCAKQSADIAQRRQTAQTLVAEEFALTNSTYYQQSIAALEAENIQLQNTISRCQREEAIQSERVSEKNSQIAQAQIQLDQLSSFIQQTEQAAALQRNAYQQQNLATLAYWQQANQLRDKVADMQASLASVQIDLRSKETLQGRMQDLAKNLEQGLRLSEQLKQSELALTQAESLRLQQDLLLMQQKIQQKQLEIEQISQKAKKELELMKSGCQELSQISTDISRQETSQVSQVNILSNSREVKQKIPGKKIPVNAMPRKKKRLSLALKTSLDLLNKIANVTESKRSGDSKVVDSSISIPGILSRLKEFKKLLPGAFKLKKPPKKIIYHFIQSCARELQQLPVQKEVIDKPDLDRLYDEVVQLKEEYSKSKTPKNSQSYTGIEFEFKMLVDSVDQLYQSYIVQSYEKEIKPSLSKDSIKAAALREKLSNGIHQRVKLEMNLKKQQAIKKYFYQVVLSKKEKFSFDQLIAMLDFSYPACKGYTKKSRKILKEWYNTFTEIKKLENSEKPSTDDYKLHEELIWMLWEKQFDLYNAAYQTDEDKRKIEQETKDYFNKLTSLIKKQEVKDCAFYPLVLEQYQELWLREQRVILKNELSNNPIKKIEDNIKEFRKQFYISADEKQFLEWQIDKIIQDENFEANSKVKLLINLKNDSLLENNGKWYKHIVESIQFDDFKSLSEVAGAIERLQEWLKSFSNQKNKELINSLSIILEELSFNYLNQKIMNEFADLKDKFSLSPNASQLSNYCDMLCYLWLSSHNPLPVTRRIVSLWELITTLNKLIKTDKSSDEILKQVSETFAKEVQAVSKELKGPSKNNLQNITKICLDEIIKEVKEGNKSSLPIRISKLEQKLWALDLQLQHAMRSSDPLTVLSAMDMDELAISAKALRDVFEKITNEKVNLDLQTKLIGQLTSLENIITQKYAYEAYVKVHKKVKVIKNIEGMWEKEGKEILAQFTRNLTIKDATYRRNHQDFIRFLLNKSAIYSIVSDDLYKPKNYFQQITKQIDDLKDKDKNVKNIEIAIINCVNQQALIYLCKCQRLLFQDDSYYRTKETKTITGPNDSLNKLKLTFESVSTDQIEVKNIFDAWAAVMDVMLENLKQDKMNNDFIKSFINDSCWLLDHLVFSDAEQQKKLDGYYLKFEGYLDENLMDGKQIEKSPWVRLLKSLKYATYRNNSYFNITEVQNYFDQHYGFTALEKQYSQNYMHCQQTLCHQVKVGTVLDSKLADELTKRFVVEPWLLFSSNEQNKSVMNHKPEEKKSLKENLSDYKISQISVAILKGLNRKISLSSIVDLEDIKKLEEFTGTCLDRYAKDRVKFNSTQNYYWQSIFNNLTVFFQEQFEKLFQAYTQFSTAKIWLEELVDSLEGEPDKLLVVYHEFYKSIRGSIESAKTETKLKCGSQMEPEFSDQLAYNILSRFSGQSKMEQQPDKGAFWRNVSKNIDRLISVDKNESSKAVDDLQSLILILPLCSEDEKSCEDILKRIVVNKNPSSLLVQLFSALIKYYLRCIFPENDINNTLYPIIERIMNYLNHCAYLSPRNGEYPSELTKLYEILKKIDFTKISSDERQKKLVHDLNKGEDSIFQKILSPVEHYFSQELREIELEIKDSKPIVDDIFCKKSAMLWEESLIDKYFSIVIQATLSNALKKVRSLIIQEEIKELDNDIINLEKCKCLSDLEILYHKILSNLPPTDKLSIKNKNCLTSLRTEVERIYRFQERFIITLDIARNGQEIIPFAIWVKKLNQHVESGLNLNDAKFLLDAFLDTDNLDNSMALLDSTSTMILAKTMLWDNIKNKLKKYLKPEKYSFLDNFKFEIFQSPRGSVILQNFTNVLESGVGQGMGTAGLITDIVQLMIESRVCQKRIDYQGIDLWAYLADKSLYTWKQVLKTQRLADLLNLNNNDADHQSLITRVLRLEKLPNQNQELFDHFIQKIAQLKCNPTTLQKIVGALIKAQKPFDEVLLQKLERQDINTWSKKIKELIEDQEIDEIKDRTLPELIACMCASQDNVNKDIRHLLVGVETKEGVKFKSELERRFDRLKQKSKEVENWNKDAIKEWAKEFKKQVQTQNGAMQEDQLYQLITVLQRAIKLERGYFPRNAQLIAFFGFLDSFKNQKGRGANIGTGEGKSLITQMLIIAKALCGERVDVVTGSKTLAIRDAAASLSLFEYFNITVANNCDEDCEQDEKVRHRRYQDNQVIFGVSDAFQRDILLTTHHGKNIRSKLGDSIIVDEMDSLLLDEIERVLYISHNIEDLKYLKDLFMLIWSIVRGSNKRGYTTEDILAIKKQVNNFIEKKTVKIPNKLKIFVERRLAIWIENAFIADQIPENTQYTIGQTGEKLGKAIIMDLSKGEEQLFSQWSNGLHQFVQLKNYEKLSNESLRAIFMSNMNFFQQYNGRIYGMTGTLGGEVERDLLASTYNLDFFQVPRFRQERYIQEEGLVLATEEAWVKAICEEVHEKVTAAPVLTQTDIEKEKKDAREANKEVNNTHGRPVLIIAEHKKSVAIIVQELKKKYADDSTIRIHVYDSTLKPFDLKEFQPGDILVATNIAGRGTDIDTSELVEKNGGPHVILSYMPSNIRIEEQAFRRTARQGKKGSGKFIVCDQRVQTHPITLEFLRDERDEEEAERLAIIKQKIIPRIKIENELFNKYVILKERIKQKLNEKFLFNHELIQLQLKSLDNQWSFWFDQMSEQLTQMESYDTSEIDKQFDEFVESINQKLDGAEDQLINDNAEILKLAVCYYHRKQYREAQRCYLRVINEDSEFAGFAHYYMAQCIFARGSSYQDKLNARKHLKKAKALFEEQIGRLSAVNQSIHMLARHEQKSGIGTKPDEFTASNAREITVIQAHLDAVHENLGTELKADDFKSGYLTGDAYKRAYRNLIDYGQEKDQENSPIKGFRVSKKVKLCWQISTKGRLSKALDELKWEDKSLVVQLRSATDKLVVTHISSADLKNLRDKNIEVEGVLSRKGEIFEFPEKYGFCKDEVFQMLAVKVSHDDKPKELKERILPPESFKDLMLIKSNFIRICVEKNVFKEKKKITLHEQAGVLLVGNSIWSNEIFGGKGDKIKKYIIDNLLNKPYVGGDSFVKEIKGFGLEYEAIEKFLIDKNIILINNYYCLTDSAKKIVTEYLTTINFNKEFINNPNLDAKLQNLGLEFFPQLKDKKDLIKEKIRALKSELKLTKENLALDEPSFRTLQLLLQKAGGLSERLINQLQLHDFNSRHYHEVEEILLTTGDSEVSYNEILVCENSEQESEKLWFELNAAGIIKSPAPNVKLYANPQGVLDTIHERIKAAKADIFKEIKVVEGDKDKYISSINETIDKALGKIKTIGALKINPQSLQDYFRTGKMPPEAVEYMHQCCDIIFSLKEDKPWWDWNAFAVAMIGIAQIALGAALQAVSGGLLYHLGSALISEGIGDIAYAIQNGISGTFSWSAYGDHKWKSMLISIASAGVGAFMARGVQVARLGMGVAATTVAKAVAKQVVGMVVEAGVSAALNMAADKLAEEATKAVFNHFKENFKEAVKKHPACQLSQLAIQETYGLYYDKFGDDEAKGIITQVLQDTLQGLQQSVNQEVSAKIFQVAQALGNQLSVAAGQLKRGGHNRAGAVLQASSMISKCVKVGQVAKCLADLTTITPKFFDEYHKALQRRLRCSQDSPNTQQSSTTEAKTNFCQTQTESHLTSILGLIQTTVQQQITGPLIQGGLQKAVQPVSKKFTKWLNQDLVALQQKADLRKQEINSIKSKITALTANSEQDEVSQLMLTQHVKRLQELKSGEVRKLNAIKNKDLTVITSGGAKIKIKHLSEYDEAHVVKVRDKHYLVRPSLSTMCDRVATGKPMGVTAMMCCAAATGFAIQHVNATTGAVEGNLAPPGVTTAKGTIKLLHHKSSKDKPQGHFSLEIVDQQGVSQYVDFTPPAGMDPTVCGYQAIRCGQLIQDQKMTVQDAKKAVENSEHLKSFLQSTAESGRQNQAFIRAYHHGAQEAAPHILGAGTRRQERMGNTPSLASPTGRSILERWAQKGKAFYKGQPCQNPTQGQLRELDHWEVAIKTVAVGPRQLVPLNQKINGRAAIHMGHKLSAAEYWTYGAISYEPRRLQSKAQKYAQKYGPNSQEYQNKINEYGTRYGLFINPGHSSDRRISYQSGRKSQLVREFMNSPGNYRFEDGSLNQSHGSDGMVYNP